MPIDNDYFKTDDKGRTILFYYSSIGNKDQVEKIIFSLPSTGLSGQRLALIKHKDNDGLTAIDVAINSGYNEIATLLEVEVDRINFFE